MTGALVEPQRLRWPDDDPIVLAVTDAMRYNEAMTRLCSLLLGQYQEGLVVTANRPCQSLRETYAKAGLDTDRLRFVDCVTSLTGLAPPPDARALHIESPTLLEKLAMRTEQTLRRMGHSRFLLLDSLSALAVYNGNAAVAELSHNLVTRLRVHRVPSALLLVSTPGTQALYDAVRPLCDVPLQL